MDNKSLDALFSGLTEVASSPAVQEKPSAQTSTKKGGKPRKGRRKVNVPEQPEARFCTIVSTEQVKKLRIIATREGLQLKEVVYAAFRKAIDSYERKNGKIVEEEKKNLDELF